MFLVAFLLLIPLTIQQTTNGDVLELRLLGSQGVISTRQETFKVLNKASKTDQLAPFLPSSTIGASYQSQKDFNFKSNNSKENNKPLCNPPFDRTLCFSNNHSKPSVNVLIDKILKPSRDLVPPFNDIQDGTGNIKIKSVIPDIEVFTPSSFSSQKNFISTTEKLPKLSNILKDKKDTTLSPSSDNSVFNNAEATNELRSYLPPQPEFSAAAQTSVSVVQKPDPNNDNDHHHHHHHHDNFNICADAFHSFLCTPLKARKRITGALPNQFSGQDSFIQSQKVLPVSDKLTASSNVLQNDYIPPVSASSNIDSTVRTNSKPVTTSVRPYSEVVPSLSDRFYLPPVSDNKIPLLINNSQYSNKKEVTLTQPMTTQSPLPFSSLVISSAVPVFPKIFNQPKPNFKLLPTTEKPIVISTNSIISSVIPQSSNEDKFYLPPNSSPLPAANFRFASQQPLSATTTIVPQTIKPFSFSTGIEVLPTLSTIIPVSHNVIPQQPKLEFVSPIISTTIKPTVFTTREKLSLPSSSLSVLQPVSTFKASNFESNPTKPKTTFSSDSTRYQTASNFISTTIKPYPSNSKITEHPTNADRSYLPPDPNIQPEAAQINPAIAVPQTKNPFHHERDLCTDPFHSFLCVGPKPRKRITGALPSGLRPDSTNNDKVKVKPASTFQNEQKTIPEKTLVPAAAQSLGYLYSKPSNPLPISTKAPLTGYSYPKPDKIFSLPSQQNEVNKYETSKITTTKKPDLPLKTSEAKIVSGYQYPKPEVSFSLPSKQEEKVATTTKSLSIGYSYPKPEAPLTLQSEQKEIRYSSPKPSPSEVEITLPINQVKGYQYPKPQQSLQLPEKNGYSYPKPEKRLELPTQRQSQTTFPQVNTNILGNSRSAEFIPVNKIDLRRAESRNLLAGYQKFGERLKKREKKPSN